MELSGSWVALVTPLGDDGKIDFARTASLVDWHRAAGTSGLVIAGTTGEAALLTDDEFRQLLGFVVDHVQGSLPIVAGAGTTSTRRSIDLSRIAFDAGADALLLVSPYYLKTSQPGLVAHYAAIADAVDLPQILYNVPARTGCDLLPETAAEIAKVANVVAVKEALPDLDRVRALVEMLPASVAVLSGDDPTSLAAMGCGAKGVISVTANVAPKQIAQLCRLWDEGTLGRCGDAGSIAGSAARSAVSGAKSHSGEVGASANGPDGGPVANAPGGAFGAEPEPPGAGLKKLGARRADVIE